MKEAQPVEPVTREVFNRQWVKGKIERHQDNLAHLTGYWHGIFYWNGVAQRGNHGLGSGNGKEQTQQ